MMQNEIINTQADTHTDTWYINNNGDTASYYAVINSIMI